MPTEIKRFIRNRNIIGCRECEDIMRLQENHDIEVAPLFWQGEGKQDIPLVIIGINPSVVGTPNEPQQGWDFDDYFNYYQFRNNSEAVNKDQARQINADTRNDKIT